MTVAPDADPAAPADSRDRVPALPVGSTLLHIGIPKTGTTTLQRSAAWNRQRLMEHGVCYPGQGMNHREPVAALMALTPGWKAPGGVAPPVSVWRSIQREVKRTDADRSLISHEFVCQSDDEQAVRFVDALGPQVHVVITLRGFADLLGSSWQQYVKAGYGRSFRDWLRQVLGEEDQLKTTPTFYRRNDQADIVDRWIRVAGRENVTVIIADKRKPDQMMNGFSDLLGLPYGVLTAPSVGGYAANRGLSAPEAELVLRVNRLLKRHGMHWNRYSGLMRHGLIARMQENRKPGPDEGRLDLPDWAAKKALVKAEGYAEAIADSGVRVIGDLAALTDPVRTVQRIERQTEVPIEAAYEAIAGLLSAEDGRGAFFDEPPEGIQGSDSYRGRLRKLTRTERGREVAHAIRATRYLDNRTVGAVAGFRAMDGLERGTRPLARGIKRARRRGDQVLSGRTGDSKSNGGKKGNGGGRKSGGPIRTVKRLRRRALRKLDTIRRTGR